MVGAVLLIIQIPTIVASGDPDLWQGLRVTVFFSVGTVPVQLTIALFLSVLLFQKLKGSEAYRIIFFIPYVTPAVASAAVFKQLFSNRATAPANIFMEWLGFEPQLWLREPDGVLEVLFRLFGGEFPTGISEWLAGPSLALSVIILQSIWTYVGYNTVIYLAGLGNIPKELTEAAEIDGANKWNVFRHITFPLLSPTTYFLSLIAVIGTFKAFNTIWVMRDGAALGTTDPFSVVIFIEFFTKTRYGYASALAFVLFAIILSLTFINNKIQGSRVFYG
jgi:multiple sugar transport system permease protein